MDLTKLDDKRLVSLASERHEGAQSVLYRRYFERIYGFFLSHLRDGHAAEDLTQETFIRGLNGLSTFRGVASFKNWLYAIAKNQLADFYRDRNSLTAELNDSLPPRKIQKPVVDAETELQLQKRTQSRIGQVFKLLPERYKKVLTLRFLKGFSIKETAYAMKTSIANIKVLQYRAIRLARERIIIN